MSADIFKTKEKKLIERKIDYLKAFDKDRNSDFLFMRFYSNILTSFKNHSNESQETENSIKNLTEFESKIQDETKKCIFQVFVTELLNDKTNDSRLFPMIILKTLQLDIKGLIQNFNEKTTSFKEYENYFYVTLFFFCNYFMNKMYDVQQHSILKSTFYDPTFNKKMIEFFDLINSVSQTMIVTQNSLKELFLFCQFLVKSHSFTTVNLKFPFNVNFCEKLIIVFIKTQFASNEISLLANVTQLKHIYSSLSVYLDLEEHTFFAILFKYMYIQKFTLNLKIIKPLDQKSQKLSVFLIDSFRKMKNTNKIMNYSIIKSADLELTEIMKTYIPQKEFSNLAFLLRMFYIVYIFKKDLKKMSDIESEVIGFVVRMGVNTFEQEIKTKIVSSEIREEQITDYISHSNDILSLMENSITLFHSKYADEVNDFLYSLKDKEVKKEPNEKIIAAFVQGFFSEFNELLVNHADFSEDIVRSFPLFLILISDIEAFVVKKGVA